MDTRRLAEKNLLFKARSGSHAYGMATPESDMDIRGVFAAGRLNVVTQFFRVEQVESKVPDDLVLWELSRYVKLVCDQNPIIVELLWVDPADILFEDPAWSMLRDMRGELLTRKLRHTYGGYAKQQLDRMKAHSKWINNPQPEEPPRPADFVTMVHNVCLPRDFNKRVPADGAWTAAECGNDTYLLFPGGSGTWFDGTGNIRSFSQHDAALQTSEPLAAIVKFNRADYEGLTTAHVNYWTWKHNRNKARGATEERLGFDTKNGAHLLRLMRTAEEALTEGIVRVRRPDAAELLAVRRGEWSYERLMAVAEDIDARLSGLEAMSPLPKTIDMAKVGGVVMQVYQRIWDVREGRTRVAVRAPADRIKGAPDPLERLVYVDVEMTGYASEEARVVEVAAVEVLGGLRTGRVFHTYVNPDADINWHAFRMHGLTRDFLKDKPGMGEIADGLLAFIGGSPMMMHGASDDIAALNHDLGLAGSPLLDRGQAFDSQRIARQLFSGTAMSLDTLCDTLGVDRSARDRGHTAILDATLLAECGLKMAMMEGYASIQNAGLRRRAERKLNTAPSRPFVRDVDVTISGDGRTAVFVLPDGTRLEAAVPDCPDTHRIIAHQHSGAVLVLPAAALDGGGRDHRPDNPEGPAVLVCRGRAVERMWFSHGRPVRPPEHAAPGCGHGM